MFGLVTAARLLIVVYIFPVSQVTCCMGKVTNTCNIGKIPKSNHCRFPRNPYYRCMTEWNELRVELSLLPNRDSFKKEIKISIRDPFMKVFR